MRPRDLLLLRRRRGRGDTDLGSNSDGLMDILCNVVGVMALITSLTGIFAAGSALNIQAPMQQKTDRRFVLLQASKEGLWNLQPAVEQMVKLDRERAQEVNRCNQLLAPERETCEQGLDGWSRQQQVGPIQMRVSHANGLIQRNGPPTVLAADLKQPEGWLEQTMRQLAKDRQAVFVVLENDGFEVYRAIKSKALQYKVPIGWEPWYKGDPVYFWGNSGRNLTVQ
ncbi:MAG: hypothetical protein FJ057_03980 [Cyanobacteria bacterium K_DeepCast_0m_m1_088]|nr:hypothetical protein [Cyanobacteria bacterium K_DeepCast_0m_m1_088]